MFTTQDVLFEMFFLKNFYIISVSVWDFLNFFMVELLFECIIKCACTVRINAKRFGFCSVLILLKFLKEKRLAIVQNTAKLLIFMENIDF